MKVVWLCHFTNREIQNIIEPHKHVNETSPWIASLAGIFEGIKDIELHIVSPHEYIGADKHFKIRGIHYHFFNAHIPIWGRHWPAMFKFDLWSDYFFNKLKIKKIINKINPDIVHLHGAENAYYSSGIIPLIGKYPVLVTIQGFIRNSSEVSKLIKIYIYVEEDIIKKCNHFGVRTIEMNQMVLSLNPRAQLHFHNYCIKTPSVLKSNIGKDEPIDCIFFARVCKDKGVEDLLAAIAIVKNEIPKISLSVIGGTSDNYLAYLKALCIELCIENNVLFLGFLPTQEDIYRYALQAKITVLPTYHDNIPGTIIESMFMKLPVIAYAVGGIPELNYKEETVILVDKQNINQLAEKIIQLVNNVDLRKTISEKAYIHAHERFNNSKVVTDILNAYKVILKKSSII